MTDMWTSPNHKVFIAVTVHFEKDGVPVSMLLDIIEVTKSSVPGIRSEPEIHRQILPAVEDGQIHPG